MKKKIHETFENNWIIYFEIFNPLLYICCEYT